jgi:hypothetical protein
MKTLILFLLWPAIAMSQISLTESTVRMVRFDGADGLSVPSPFYLTGSGVPGTFGGLFTATSSVNAVRVNAYSDPTDPDQVAFGMKRASTSTPAFLELPLVNDTGRPLRRLIITFRVWQISQNLRATRLKLTHYRDPITQVITNSASLVSSQEYVSTTGTEAILGTYVKQWLTAEIEFQTPIPVSAGVNLGWNFIHGDGSSGNAHLAIEEIRLFPDFAHRAISADAGWRMLAVPFSDVSVAKFGEQFALQGIPGLGHSLFSPNLYTGYDGSAWQVPSSGSEALRSGKGLIWYKFAGSDLVPGVFGHEPTTDVDVPLHATGNRWNLIGNPYMKPISVSALEADGNFVPVVQVWQDATDESLGSWILSTDPALGGIIAPWQAFMLQNGAENAASTLTIPLTAKTTGGAGFFKDDETAVRIPIELVRRDGERWIRHDRGPMIEFDARSSVVVQRLAPLDAGAAYGWFRGRTGSREATSGVDPHDDTDVSIAYDLSVPGSGLWRIRWNDIPTLPDGWTLRFHDLTEGVEVDVMDDDGYGFVHPGDAAQIEGRFLFVAKKATQTSLERRENPSSVAMLSAWPNPFNPVTVVGYTVETQDLASVQVRLSVHDILGREVAVLIDAVRPAGTHQVRFDAAHLASGVYLVRLQTSDISTLQLITLIK